jgi:hypothetical protein
MKRIKIKDNTPQIKYKGRKFEIESDGTYHGTKVKINGNDTLKIKSLILDCGSPTQPPTIKMEVFDL